VKFIGGLILGLLIVPSALICISRAARRPCTTDRICRSRILRAQALMRALRKTCRKNVPIQPTETTTWPGRNCTSSIAEFARLAVVAEDGNRDGNVSAAAAAIPGKGVTDDEPGETYWKIFNRHSTDRYARLQQNPFGDADVADGAAAGECRQAAACSKSGAGRARRSECATTTVRLCLRYRPRQGSRVPRRRNKIAPGARANPRALSRAIV